MKLRVILSILAVLLTMQLSFVSGTHAQATPRRVEITAKRFSFTPGEITLKKGEPVVLVLRSEDATHGLSFKALGVNFKAAKGQTSEFPFTPDKTGDFPGQCSNFCGSGHGSMKMTVHVVD